MERKGNSGDLKDLKSLFTKATTTEYPWEDKDEFLDTLYWLRQIIGLVLGIIWGILPLKGIFALIVFFAFNILITYYYTASFHKIDDEDYGGFTELVKEGMMTSFATFLVSWIVIFSALHGVHTEIS